MVEHDIGETEARDVCFALERRTSTRNKKGEWMAKGVSLKRSRLYTMSQRSSSAQQNFPHATDAESE